MFNIKKHRTFVTSVGEIVLTPFSSKLRRHPVNLATELYLSNPKIVVSKNCCVVVFDVCCNSIVVQKIFMFCDNLI